MSSYWSLYIVPDHWTLKDCMVTSYMTRTEFMMSDEEIKEYFPFKQKEWIRLYDELCEQSCLCDYTSDDGDPDHERIMELLPPFGRLYRFSEELHKLMPELEKFLNENEGKRYICMN